ncbi:MAG TPA: ABC transporter permease [Lachnospiraceae bacterium]|nr:ABC transporter permease [Lachnospiraceae bacterium]
MIKMTRWIRYFVLFLFLVVWELCSRTGVIDAFFFSSPTRVFTSILSMAKNGSIFVHTGVTLLETIVSFVLTLFISTFISTLLWYFNRVSDVIEPYLVALNSLPKSALAPLLIVWLGTGIKTIIIAGISVAIFGSIINMYYGFKQSDPEKMKLIYTLGGTRKDVLFKIIIPSSIPIILSNMKVNIGLCLVGVIIGEFLAARRGLGYLIIYSSQIFKLDYLIMSIIILCCIAMLLYQGIQVIEKLYNKNK